LEEIKGALDGGVSLKRLADEHFSSYIRYGRAFKEYKRQVTKPREVKSVTILLVGPSGIGKSRFATLLCQYLAGNSSQVYKVPRPKGSGLYWDDYDGQRVAFMDEFDGNFMQPTAFNELADRYEYVVPVHGGAGHQFVSKYLVICSNYLPKYWWRKRNAEQLRQTTRRLDLVIPMLRPVRRVEQRVFLHNNVPTSWSSTFVP